MFLCCILLAHLGQINWINKADQTRFTCSPSRGKAHVVDKKHDATRRRQSCPLRSRCMRMCLKWKMDAVWLLHSSPVTVVPRVYEDRLDQGTHTSLERDIYLVQACTRAVHGNNKCCALKAQYPHWKLSMIEAQHFDGDVLPLWPSMHATSINNSWRWYIRACPCCRVCNTVDHWNLFGYESCILQNENLDIKHKLAGRNLAREAGEISVVRSAESNNLLRIYLTDGPANAPWSRRIYHVKQYIIPALMWRLQMMASDYIPVEMIHGHCWN